MGILARMRGLAARSPDRDAPDVAAGLGTSMLAVRTGAHAAAADGSVAVHTPDGIAWLVSVRTMRCLVAPFAAAPEIGLRIDYCFDPGGDQARFALLLESEADRSLQTKAIEAALQDAVQSALQCGSLELPPCTTDEEWHAFRAGLNELVHTRFGLVVEDCIPVDLHPEADYAAALLAATAVAASPAPAASSADGEKPWQTPASQAAQLVQPTVPAPRQEMGTGGHPAPSHAWYPSVEAEDVPLHALRAAANATRDASGDDSLALRRLFLELPALAAGFRALPMKEGDGSFAPMQDICRRLSLAALTVNTMPTLAMAAPGRKLPRAAQQLRALHAVAAQSALDEAWAMLAAMRSGLDTSAVDGIDRILSNLEHSLAQRRAPAMEGKP
jgi:hypothetical protein